MTGGDFSAILEVDGVGGRGSRQCGGKTNSHN